MIAFSEGNIHDIDHLIRVWTYARTIGELEKLDPEERTSREGSACRPEKRLLTERLPPYGRESFRTKMMLRNGPKRYRVHSYATAPKPTFQLLWFLSIQESFAM